MAQAAREKQQRLAAEQAAGTAAANCKGARADAVAARAYADQRDAAAEAALVERNQAKAEIDAAHATRDEALRLVEFHRSAREAAEQAREDYKNKAMQIGLEAEELSQQLGELGVREAEAQ